MPIVRRPESYLEQGDTNYSRDRLVTYHRRQRFVRLLKGTGRFIVSMLGEAAKINPGYSEQPPQNPQE